MALAQFQPPLDLVNIGLARVDCRGQSCQLLPHRGSLDAVADDFPLEIGNVGLDRLPGQRRA
jgi:hypothetical protein